MEKSGSKKGAYNAAYKTTEAGLIMFKRSFAQEWSKFNINTNVTDSGYVPTDFTSQML